jgi:flagellar protein FlaG
MINSLANYLTTAVKTDTKVSRPVAVIGAVSKADDDNASGKGGLDGHVNPEQVQEAAKQVAERLQSNQRTLQFSVDPETKSTVVKVIDSETNQVIRQIPSEEILSISKRLEAATGVLFSASA